MKGRVWLVLTLWGPGDLPVGRGPLRLDGRNRNRSRASTIHPIRTMGSVRSSPAPPPPPTDPPGPGTESKHKNNTSLHFTRVIDRRASHLRTCSQWKKRSIVVIHTFLRAVCVCAVGLRLPELKERLQKEHSGCNRRAEWEKYKLTAYCYQHSFTYRCCEAATWALPAS